MIISLPSLHHLFLPHSSTWSTGLDFVEHFCDLVEDSGGDNAAQDCDITPFRDMLFAKKLVGVAEILDGSALYAVAIRRLAFEMQVDRVGFIVIGFFLFRTLVILALTITTFAHILVRLSPLLSVLFFLLSTLYPVLTRVPVATLNRWRLTPGLNIW